MNAETEQYLTETQLAWIAKVLPDEVMISGMTERVLWKYCVGESRAIHPCQHAFLVGLVEAKLTRDAFKEYDIALYANIPNKNRIEDYMARYVVCASPNYRCKCLMSVWKD